MTIVFLLALGTGGIISVFNPVYSLMSARLPFPQSDRLVVIGGNIPMYNTSLNGLEKHEAFDILFSSMAAYVPTPTTSIIIPGAGKYRVARALEVTEDFFNTIGVHPFYGYDFLQYKDISSVVISNRFWRNQLDHTMNVIGESIQVNDLPGVIAGIMPDAFDFPGGIDIWFCDRTPGIQLSSERQFLGRLRSGISIEQAANILKTIKIEPSDSNGILFGKDGPVLQPLKNILYGDRQYLLLSLSIAAILFLLLVCSGVMSIIVTQETRRKSEITMRLILGESRRSIVFQQIKDKLLMIVAGAAAGLWLSRITGIWLHVKFPILQSGEIITPVKITFFLALVTVVTIICCVVPALYISSVDLNTYLKSGVNSKRGLFTMREVLSGLQLSLALALLAGTGLLLRSLAFKVEFPVGWSNREIAVVMLKFPLETTSYSTLYSTLYSTEAMTRRANLSFEFQNQLEAMPEVIKVGILNPIPFSDDAEQASQALMPIYRDREVFSGLGQPGGVVRGYIQGRVSPEGFNMLGIPLLAGRLFTLKEVADELEYRRDFQTGGNIENRTGVVIINEYLAKRFWQGENAIGKIMYDAFGRSLEIVGVVQNFYQVANRKEFIPTVYSPSDTSGIEQKFLIQLRSNTSMNSFRQRILDLNTGSAYTLVQDLKQNVAESTANMRLSLLLLGCFALLGIIISGLSVYATAALTATSRNREIGIRMAMGAQQWNILCLALWRGIRPIIIGLPIGLFLAWILARMLSSFIFQVNAGDLLVWGVSCIFLIFLTIIAALIPALQAIRVNPADVLRNE